MLKRFIGQKNQSTNNELYTKSKVIEGEIPNHVAIIMDGNGRWAKKRSMPRVAGHHEGMKTVRKITKLASDLGIKTLTLYAFSTENWKRPETEVDFLMKLPAEFLDTFLPDLIENNVQVRSMGDPSKLPAHTIKAVTSAIEKTKDNNGMILNFALNYGSRLEIIEAVQKVAADVKNENIQIDDINESMFNQYLLTDDLQDPDLLIRTSGEIRLSNFMLWQLAYSEFWFTDVLWPDFSESDFLQAITEYQQRGRRFGGIS